MEVNGDQTLTTVANRPAGTGSSTSTVTVLAPAGNDTVLFQVYDGQNGTGNILGQQTAVQTITAGTNNTINATIDALVASVQIAPLANQPTVTPTTDPNGNVAYSVLGDVPVTFAATPYDADGNVIVGSGDPITYSASTVSSDISVALVNGQPNEFSVHASSGLPSSNEAGFTITATDSQNTFAQSNAHVLLNQLVYVAYENGGTGTVAALDANGNPVALPGGFAGIVDPKGIAVDTADQRLYVADKGANAVLAFNSDGTTFSGAYSSPAFSKPIGVTYDEHDNELYVLDATGVHVMNPDGSPGTVASGTPFANLNQPSAIAYYAAPPSTFWIYVTDAGNNRADRYDELGNPQYLSLRAYISLGTLVPAGVTQDPDFSGLVVTGNSSGSPQMTAFTSAGGMGTSQTAGLSAPSGVVYDVLTDQVYVVNAASGAVTIYDGRIAGLVQTLAAPPSLSVPSAITIVY